LKNTFSTWEEREAMEERAKIAIEQWERSQVQRGLRGEKGTREVLDEVLMGFSRTLDDCEKRWKLARAKYAVPVAAKA
jgi:MoxR-like ATPase